MSIVGKTIAAVERAEDSSTQVRIRFTDGSALDIEATGWEVEDLDWEELTSEQLHAREAREQIERERRRARQIENEALMAERRSRGEEERALIGAAFAEAIREEMLAARHAYLRDMNRMAYGDPPR